MSAFDACGDVTKKSRHVEVKNSTELVESLKTPNGLPIQMVALQ